MAVHHVRREIDRQREREEDDRRFTSSLAGLAVSLFLIWIGLYVTEHLAAQAKLEDCMMQGRIDCLRVDMTAQR
jgi:hypothetical protein